MRGTVGFRDRLTGHTQGTRILCVWPMPGKSRVPTRESNILEATAHFHRLREKNACAPSAVPNFTAFIKFHRLTFPTSTLPTDQAVHMAVSPCSGGVVLG